MENPNDLIQIACNETGLSDFGGDSFREGLERLVGSLNNEARLNAAGEHALRSRIFHYLSQRLHVEDWYRRHPEIEDVELLPVLFGISLPRTGSTALSYLLSCDPAIRYLRVWESSQPCPPPSTVQGPDPRRGQVSESDALASKRGQNTPTGIDGAMECLDLLALDFKSQMFQAFARVPSYVEWFNNADIESAYRYERRVLKMLQWGEKPRSWRLKTPMHLLFLRDLDKVFPDARFVMTHRDPTEVIMSVAMVFESISANFTDHLDLGYIGAVNVATWSEGIRRAMAFREAGNDHRFYDIHFRAMHHDPEGEVRGLYRWLGEDVSDTFAASLTDWWQQNSADRPPAVRPDPSHYGIDIDQVRRLFADYNAKVPNWTGWATG